MIHYFNVQFSLGRQSFCLIVLHQQILTYTIVGNVLEENMTMNKRYKDLSFTFPPVSPVSSVVILYKVWSFLHILL